MSKNISDQLVEALVDAGIQRIYAAFFRWPDDR
jgi:hypothetical protein